MSSWLAFLLPWEFSPLAVVLALGAAVAFVRGARRAPAGQAVGIARWIGFFSGLVLLYFVMQTHFDYVSQHMFFIHRIQHLVLHHAGPFLIAISQPQAVIARGLPDRLHDRVLSPLWRHPLAQFAYRLLQNWLVAPVLFVGLIFFWLTPEIHFYAMLSGTLYHVMNWSMLVDGLLFWFLMLDPRTKEQGALLSLGPRIGLLLAAAVPQLMLGADIGLATHDIYTVYGICGRAWPISAIEDQQLGGLVTWIPAGMMHAVGTLVLLSYWMRSK